MASKQTVASKAIEERNPYKFIEKTLSDARVKLDKMKGTPQLLETLSDVRLSDQLFGIEPEEEEVPENGK